VIRTARGLLPMLFLAWLTGCGVPSGPPNILVVVLDTLRADAAGLHTPATPAPLRVRHLTPNLDALASQGVTYSDCTSVAPWTVPSHASMFTGRLPGAHGCVSGRHYFTSELPTFADELRGAGWSTAAFFSNPWLADRATGLLRGFDERIEARLPMKSFERPRAEDQGGGETVAAFRAWLEKREDGRPFLAFVNILESHLAYDPPPEYRAAHLDDLPAGDVVDMEWSQAYQAGLVKHDEVDWNRVARLYAGDVWHADRLLGDVLEGLRSTGRHRDTVVIVTSDHGEHLGEHRLVEHQFSLYEPLLRVPMVVVVPDGYRRRFRTGVATGDVRTDPVQTVDLFATILDLADVASPVSTPFSRSLFGGPQSPSRPVFAEYAGPPPGLVHLLRYRNPALDLTGRERALRSVRVGSLRLIVDDAGGEQWFDLRVDPSQKFDLSGERVSGREELRALIVGLDQAHASGQSPPAMDTETLDRLRALGYVP
jgi:arylsulfatase A-like enzyme